MDKHAIEQEIVTNLKQVFDPEIPVNIYDLGLVYEIILDEDTDAVVINMTLTNPNCPEAGPILGTVYRVVKMIPGVGNVKVNLVFEPPWDQTMMTEDARLDLGLL